MTAPNVLFLCNRNAIRSPMAAVLLCSLGGTAESAGVIPGEPDTLSEMVLGEIGLSIPGPPRPVDQRAHRHVRP